MTAKPLCELVIFSSAVLSLTLGALGAAHADAGGGDEEPIVDERPADEKEAIDIFTRNFVWAQDRTTVGVNQVGVEVSRTTDTLFYQGRHKVPLEGEEFYSTVGRDDLAGDYRSRNNFRRGVLWSGIALGVGGVATMFAPLFLYDATGVEGEYTGREADQKFFTFLWIGAGIAMVGSISAITSTRIDPHPIEPHERRELAEEYNIRLLEELELDEDEVPEETEDRLRVHDVGLAPYIATDENSGVTTGGLVIGGRF